MADVNNRMAPISQPTTDHGYGDTSVSCLDGRIVEVLNEKQLTVAIAGKKETHLQTYERIKDFSTGFFSKGFWKSIGLVLSNLLAGKTLFGHTFGYSEKVVNANTNKNLDVSRKTTNLSNILDAVASTGSRGANTYADAVSWVAEGKHNPVGIVAARANAADPADRSVTRDKRYSENLPKLAKVIAQAAYSSPEHANAADKSHQLVASVKVALTAHAAFRNEDGVDTERLARTIMDFNGLVAAELAEQKLLAMVEADEAPTTIAGVVDVVKQASQEAGLHTQDASTQIEAVLSKMTDETSELGQALAPTLEQSATYLEQITEGLVAIDLEALTLPRVYTAAEKAEAVAQAEKIHSELSALLAQIEAGNTQVEGIDATIKVLGRPVTEDATLATGRPAIVVETKIVDGEEVQRVVPAAGDKVKIPSQLKTLSGAAGITAQQEVLAARQQQIAELTNDKEVLLAEIKAKAEQVEALYTRLNTAKAKLENIEECQAELEQHTHLIDLVKDARMVYQQNVSSAELFENHENFQANYAALGAQLVRFADHFVGNFALPPSSTSTATPVAVALPEASDDNALSLMVDDSASADKIRAKVKRAADFAAANAAELAANAMPTEHSAEEIAQARGRVSALQGIVADFLAKGKAVRGLKAYADSQQEKRNLNAAEDRRKAKQKAFTALADATAPGIALTREAKAVEEQRAAAEAKIAEAQAKIAHIQGQAARRKAEAVEEQRAAAEAKIAAAQAKIAHIQGQAARRKAEAVEEQIAAAEARFAHIQGLPARRKVVQQRTGVPISPMA